MTNLSKYIYLFFFLCLPVSGLSEEDDKEICFNLYIISKLSANSSELKVFDKQKKIAEQQISQTQIAFDKNIERHCPKMKFSKGVIKQVSWNEALKLSQPLDKNKNESEEQYLFRKLQEAFNEVKAIIKKINDNGEIKQQEFFQLYPARAVAEVEYRLKKYNDYQTELNADNNLNTNNQELIIKSAIEKIKLKLYIYGKEDGDELIKKAKERLNKYNKIDESSALSWVKGELILWNDIEVQNTSVELKNLMRNYRNDNQCLDVYIIPEAKTPSTHVKEFEKNGKWTKRDGAAISTKNFPRTTAGKGHAIILAYNSNSSEFRLAHELGHLLIDVPNAHRDKKETDLMHEFSKGGTYLNEAECQLIREKVRTFHGGSN